LQLTVDCGCGVFEAKEFSGCLVNQGSVFVGAELAGKIPAGYEPESVGGDEVIVEGQVKEGNGFFGGAAERGDVPGPVDLLSHDIG
jgi:hypothetical protein